jgi:two-component system, OmpR family, phosphate regulon sensor histidine kinase PhoR
MEWLVVGVVGVLLLGLAIFVWQRWIAPWRSAEELTDALATGGELRSFLLSGNQRVRRLGQALEKFAERHEKLRARVREAEFSMAAILSAMPDGLIVVDRQRHLRVINAAFARIFETTQDNIGASLLELARDAVIDRAVSETLRTGEPQQESIRLTQRSGDELQLEVLAAPLWEKTEELRGAVILFRDVTRVRQIEEMRRDFVANVSHELRTPLSIFRGYIEALLENPKQPRAELVRIFEVMERHSQRLQLLVEDVLSLAQLEEPRARLRYTDIYVPDFLATILRDWQKRFDAKLLHPTLDAPADLPVISADENRLQEVIYNLLDNAVKYSQPEGRVGIGAERVGNRLRLSISDEGIGVPARDLPRIFERFYRTDKARSRELGGTGLGLSIVKHIAELHGGSVQAESELGQGTTIRVILPIRPETEMRRVTKS